MDWSHERDQDCVEGGEVADRSITVPSESAENATYQVGGQLTLGAIYPSLGTQGCCSSSAAGLSHSGAAWLPSFGESTDGSRAMDLRTRHALERYRERAASLSG